MFLVLKSLGLICAICFASAAFAQNRYQITRIPTAHGANSAALGINNKGEVVGYSFQGEDYQAFLYSSSDQSLADLGSLGGKINAACAINDAGQVTGYSQDGNGNLLAFLFSRTQPIASLGTLDNASTSEAFGINSHGAVVGDSQSGTQNHRPALFSNGSVQDLGIGGSNDPDILETAYAINEAGQIVGRRSAGNKVSTRSMSCFTPTSSRPKTSSTASPHPRVSRRRWAGWAFCCACARRLSLPSAW